MALADADLLDLTRTLWSMTALQASDAWALAWIPRLREHVDLDVYGDQYDEALAALLAHTARKHDPLGAYGAFDGAAGAVTSIRTSKLSATFATPTSMVGSDASLLTTAPGRHFDAITRSRELTWLPIVVGR